MLGTLQVTTGVSDDLSRATQFARLMVADCGMSDLLGPMCLRDVRGSNGMWEELAPATREKIDAEVARILQEAAARVQLMMVWLIASNSAVQCLPVPSLEVEVSAWQG